MADGLYSLTLLDYSNEKSSSRIHTGEVTALTLPGLLTQVGAYRSAVDGITLGTLQKEALQVFDTTISNVPPTDKTAQRESKWLITYQDNTANIGVGVPNPGFGKKFSVEIPTADPSLLVNNTDYADILTGAMATYVTAFQAMGHSPYGGTPLVLSAKFIGRNI